MKSDKRTQAIKGIGNIMDVKPPGFFPVLHCYVWVNFQADLFYVFHSAISVSLHQRLGEYRKFVGKVDLTVWRSC